MLPTDCRECRDLFYSDASLQIKVSLVVREEGVIAAHEYINEWFAEEHEEHGCDCPSYYDKGAAPLADFCPVHGTEDG